MLIATWNVNSLNARMPRVEEWINEVQPDVLCMQETKMTDAQFPGLDFQRLGYESIHYGEGRWNGVAILSKCGIEKPIFGFDDGEDPDPDARMLWATCGGVRIGTAYVPNGRELTNDHYVYKLAWLGRLRVHLDRHHDPSEDLLLLGDWNVAPTDLDVWDPKMFEGSTHVSPPERKAIDTLMDWGLVDTLRERYPEPGIYSFWDYRDGNFHKRRGMRIDYLLSSRSLAAKSVNDLVDRNARKGTKPSDHAPVLGVFDLREKP